MATEAEPDEARYPQLALIGKFLGDRTVELDEATVEVIAQTIYETAFYVYDRRGKLSCLWNKTSHEQRQFCRVQARHALLRLAALDQRREGG